MKNLFDFCGSVRLETDSPTSHSGGDFWGEFLRKIHGVGNHNDGKVAITLRTPFDKIVKDILVFGVQKVNLINDKQEMGFGEPDELVKLNCEAV